MCTVNFILVAKKSESTLSYEEICSRSFEVLSAVKDPLHFFTEESTNAVEISLGFFMLKSEEDVPLLINSARKVKKLFDILLVIIIDCMNRSFVCLSSGWTFTNARLSYYT